MSGSSYEVETTRRNVLQEKSTVGFEFALEKEKNWLFYRFCNNSFHFKDHLLGTIVLVIKDGLFDAQLRVKLIDMLVSSLFFLFFSVSDFF